MRTTIALVALLAACGGSTKKNDATIVGNNTGATDGSGSAEPPGDARVVQRTAAGGVIELAGDRSAAMAAADNDMAAHCGASNYTITQEGEEAIGGDSVAGGATKTEVAWRVHYQCAGTPPPPPP